MAERRMFAKTIVLSDAFLDMPMSARCLYMTLGMVADDDGFVNSPRSVMRQCGASEDDMLILLSKKFVLSFDSGVIVIKHWRINNYLQKDRYTETKYINEKNELSIDEKGAYHMDEQSMYTQGVYTQDRLGKESIDKDSVGKESIGNNNNSISLSTREKNEKMQQAIDYAKLAQTMHRLGNDDEARRFAKMARDEGIPMSLETFMVEAE